LGIFTNRARGTLSIAAFLLGAALIFGFCSEAGLQPIPEPIDYVNDKLSVTGQFCSSPADEVAFPVKILIVMDQSASLQCTDPGNNRLNALNEAGSALDSLPNVEFGVIGFASWTEILDFTPNWNEARERLAPESGQGGPATDYQGALSTTLRVLEQDMIDSGAAMRARTKYLVLFMSDGIPEPRCRAGCDDNDSPPDSLYPVCNTTEDIPDEVYVAMHSMCPEYNQDPQIQQKVRDIMSLGDFYGIGDLKLNTILLFAPAEAVAAQCGDVSQFGYVREEAEPTLRGMADEGLGTFRDVNLSEEIDFLDFDYESLQAPYEVAEFFALNGNTVILETGLGVDSDGDGMDDEVEFAAKLDRLSGDSDGDLFSDLFETQNQARGFDPLDPEVPSMGCTATQDRDADGLRECEEVFLGTDPLLPDSDGDRIPDGIELRFGIDPTQQDTRVDHDFDGRFSGAEIHFGTSPIFPDDESNLFDSVRYSVERSFAKPDGVQCYDFSVDGITLVPTMPMLAEDRKKGMNRVLLYFEEEPANMAGSRGRFYVACVEARYLGDTFKDPPSGMISGLNPDRFVELQLFDPTRHCLKLGENASDLPDGGML
jgi:hypothetical protein